MLTSFLVLGLRQIAAYPNNAELSTHSYLLPLLAGALNL